MIGTAFLFTRIPFVVKTSVAVLITAVYTVLVVYEFDYIFAGSPSTNVNLNAKYSHFLLIIITLGIFHLMERQTEFIAKVDYK